MEEKKKKEKKNRKGILSGFKAFISRGNILDLAVAVVIGMAFSAIITSLVGDIINPPLGLLIGGVDFTNLGVTLKPAVYGTDGTIIAPAVILRYGAFIQSIISFLIIAFAIYLFYILIKKLQGIPRRTKIRKLAKLKKQGLTEEAAVLELELYPPAAIKNDEKMVELLTQIKELLKERSVAENK